MIEHQPSNFLGRESPVESFANGRPQPFFKQLAASLVALRDCFGSDGKPSASERLADAIGLEDLEGFGDRVRIDRQLHAEGSDAWKKLAWDQHPVGHGELDLPNNLFVDRDAVVWIDREKHE